MKRKQWLFSAGLVILLILVSFIVRFRFEDKQMDEYIKKASILPSVYSDQFDPDLSTTAYEIFDNSLDTYDELEENADTVVVGEVMDQCQNHGTVKTLIQIRQVIKGNLTESESIEVYEPVNFTEDPRDFPDGRLEGSSGYLLMKKGQSYILFLQISIISAPTMCKRGDVSSYTSVIFNLYSWSLSLQKSMSLNSIILSQAISFEIRILFRSSL